MTELRGSLRKLGLTDFVQFLSQQRRTGCLKITQAGIQGEIAFKNGKIVNVASGAERGESALELIALALADGDFVYADATTSLTEPERNTETEELDVELQAVVDKMRREAAPVLTSVPRFLNSAPGVDDEVLALSREDIAVLVAVDGRRTAAELLHGRPTLHALHTLTRLSELGILQLEPVPTPIIDETAVASQEVETTAPVVVADERPTAAHGSAQSERVGLPQVRAGPSRRLRWLPGVLQVLALTAVFVLVLRIAVQSVHVEGQSMLPELHESELLLVDRTAYFHDEGTVLADVVPFTAQGETRYPLGGPRRGDVVVLNSPVEPGVELLKRIVGLPGENLRIADGQLYINELPLDEPYKASDGSVADSYPGDGQVIHIPDDSYFVLGDNRAVSQDSRQGWLVRANDLVGRAWLAYWPPSDWGLVQHVNPVVMQPVAPTLAVQPLAEATAVTSVPVSPPPIPPTLTSTPEALPTVSPFLLSGAVGAQPGWPSDPAGTAFYDGSTYRLRAIQATHFVALAAPLSETLADTLVTAVFHKVGGPPGGGYGIIIRDQGPGPRDGVNQRGHFYVAESGDRGEVGIWRRDDDHWVDLVPWTPSDAVYLGGTSNELALRAEGSRLVFSVNGHEVASVRDAALSRGQVGAFVGGDSNEVVLDRYTVQLLPAGVPQ